MLDSVPGQRRTLLQAVVLLVALTLTGCAGEAAQEPSPVAAPAPSPTPTPSPPPLEPAPVAEPVSISIPAIEVSADIVQVGLQPDGAMETPDFGVAGWYRAGPKPGEQGPSVIVAHVDSRAGPDVFYRLSELQPGAEVDVTRADGTTVSFVVESSEQTDKDALPTDRIWNATDQPVLRLITCGGDFNRSTRHYEDNVVVYASLAATAR